MLVYFLIYVSYIEKVTLKVKCNTHLIFKFYLKLKDLMKQKIVIFSKKIEFICST